MIRLAANLSMLFTEHKFIERFSAAAAAGFRGVEYLFPYEFEANELRAALDKNKLTQVLFNLPPGNWEAGERGLASLPGREQEFRDSVTQGIHYAEALNCPQVHAMAGLMPADATDEVCEEYLMTYVKNLRYAAGKLAKVGKTLLIEPINGRDMPGFFLQRQAQAADILARVGADNLRVQFDIYHCQITEGDLIRNLEAQFPHIGHIQVAGVPERHEPDSGEVNYPSILSHLDSLGYQGWVGCEYRPAGSTRAGLRWGEEYGLTT